MCSTKIQIMLSQNIFLKTLLKVSNFENISSSYNLYFTVTLITKRIIQTFFLNTPLSTLLAILWMNLKRLLLTNIIMAKSNIQNKQLKYLGLPM